MKMIRGCLRKTGQIFLLILVMAVCMSAGALACYAEEEADEKRIMVSMGDSYSSGEGIPPFYGQDDQRYEKVNNPDWLAHRSQKAWSGMLSLPSVSGKMSDHKDDNWFFVAASGAETKHLLNEFHKDAKKGLVLADSTNPEVSLEPQLHVFDRFGKNEVDYVTLTLGGNDADFVGIITKCILRGSDKTISNYLSPGELSDQLNHTWEYFFEQGGIRDNLYKAYHDIADRVGDRAQIIVAGYPQLLNPEGGFMISSEEADLVDKNVTKFNKAIENVVKQCRDEGLQISFVSVEEAFKGHAAYSKDSYINEVMYYLNDEDLTDFAMPPVSAYSIHPNEKGARAYANCVQQRIDELESIANGELNNDFTVSVFDVNDRLYDNYLIIIEGEEYTGLLKWGFLRKTYSRTIEVDTAEEVSISLPKGDYIVMIVDGSDENNQYHREIKIRASSKNERLEFRTIFGEHEEKPAQEGTKTDQDIESVALYNQVIEGLESEYGELRIGRYEGGYEANGLCYLNLIDFTKDGKDELMAVCKKENEEHYTGFIYTIRNGNAELLYENSQIEYENGQSYGEILLSYTDDTGYVIETGWEAASGDAEDKTVYWYDGEGFSQVYRSKGYWDNSQRNAIMQEEVKIIDLYDDLHRGQFWENMSEVWLRHTRNRVYLESSLRNIILKVKSRLEGKSVEKDTHKESNEKNSSDFYRGIIEQYQEVLTNHYNDYELESIQSKYPLLNYDLIRDAYINEYELSYWLYDIDQNGTEELFITSDDGSNETNGYFYALYTQGENQIIPLITDCVYRTMFYVCEDGSIIEHGSGGASYGGAIVYKMHKAGDRIVLNDGYEIDYENYPDAPYFNGKERLTEEEFDTKYRMVDSSVFVLDEFN